MPQYGGFKVYFYCVKYEQILLTLSQLKTENVHQCSSWGGLM
jgi:hypothetical protein